MVAIFINNYCILSFSEKMYRMWIICMFRKVSLYSDLKRNYTKCIIFMNINLSKEQSGSMKYFRKLLFFLEIGIHCKIMQAMH